MVSANTITMIRIAMVPVFMIFAMDGSIVSMNIALAIFILASLTDWLDGYIARKYNQITDFGKFIDPLADKLLVLAAILIFLRNGQISIITSFIILGREFIITSLRIVAIGKNVVMAATMSGKIKTVVQMVCLAVMMTELVSFNIYNNFTLGFILEILMAAVTLYSGYDYLHSNWGVIKDSV